MDGAYWRQGEVAVLLSHFVTHGCICGMDATCWLRERSSPKAACGAAEGAGLEANAQYEPS